MYKKLTIAIPTFNRSTLLSTTLESVDSALKKIDPHLSQVEVIISNNASTDDTNLVCLKYPHFKYFEQTVNLGYDGNVAFLYQQASGEYLLLLSDDDIFECEGLSALIASIDKNPQTDVFFCNWYSATKNSIKKTQVNPLISKNQPNFEYALIKQITPFYFLSSFVLRKSPLDTEVLMRGTYAIQMEIALQVLNEKSDCRVISEFLVGRIEPEIELVGGNNDSSRSWRIHLGFTRVRRKYQNKFGINMSPVAELSSALTAFHFFKNSEFPFFKRLITFSGAIICGVFHTKYLKLIELPKFLYCRYLR